MTDKEHIRFDCTVHSGIRAEVDDLKQSNGKQWDVLGLLQTSKASSSQMWKVLGIFLIISMAVVGFLWATQSSSTTVIIKKIEVMDEKNTEKREETNKKIDSMRDRVNELVWTVDQIKKK